MGEFGQLVVLLQKNWKLKLRNKASLIFEAIIPILSVAIILLGLSALDSQPVEKSTEAEDQGFWINKVYFHPKSKATLELMDKFEERLRRRMKINTTIEGKLTEVVNSTERVNVSHENGRYLIELHKAEGEELPKKLTYTIRTDFWELKDIVYQEPAEVGETGAKEYGYINQLQWLMGESVSLYWETKKGFKYTEIKLQTKKFETPEGKKFSLTSYIASFLPFFMILGFFLTVAINAKSLVMEKEIRVKEMMKIMGMSPAMYGLSWCITIVTFLGPTFVLYVLLLGAPVAGLPVLDASFAVLFLLFTLFYMALITFIFLLGSIFSSTSNVAILSGFIYAVMHIIGYYVLYGWETTRGWKFGLSLLFQVAFHQGLLEIMYASAVGETLDLSNFTTPVHHAGVSIAEMMLMLLVDSLWHVVATWYISNISPFDVGVRRPFYFPCTPDYWRASPIEEDLGSEEKQAHITDKYFEAEPTQNKVGVRISDLVKNFRSFKAVRGVSLNLYEEQITVLLGHNGAGKTTTMNMITGIFPPTKGTAFINGYDIKKQTREARQSMGVCPQHNVLFPKLTVREHLLLYAKLKGVPKETIQSEVEKTAVDCELINQMNMYSKNLSGGQQRKLSVGIALIGGSKVVVLDEPSAGMDPTARRSMWGILQRSKDEGRTLLLTTHYMDEADTLGDRIAIMSGGRVICCGSSLFLKKLYGTGYKLVIVTLKSCNIESLTLAVQSQVESAKFRSIVTREVVYNLPSEEKSRFHHLFRYLEQNKTALGISSYGLSETTLEEVFLNAGDEDFEKKNIAASIKTEDNDTTKSESHQDTNASNQEGSNDPTDNDETVPTKESDTSEFDKIVLSNQEDVLDFNYGFENLKKGALIFSRMYGTFIKRAVDLKRSPFMAFLQVVFPVLATFAALAVSESMGKKFSQTDNNNQQTTVTGLHAFENLFVPFSSNGSINADGERLQKIYLENILCPGCKGEKTDDMRKWALNKIKKIGALKYRTSVVIGMEKVKSENATDPVFQIVAYYSRNAVYSMFITVDYAMNAIFKFGIDESQREDYHLQSEIKKYEYVEEGDETAALMKKVYDVLLNILAGFIQLFFLVIAGNLLITLIIRFLIQERQTGAKHVQKLSGVDGKTYWLPTFLFDAVFCMAVLGIIVIVFIGHDLPVYRDGRIVYLFLAFLLFTFGGLPSVYLFQFLFKSPTTGLTIGIVHPLFSAIFTGIFRAIMFLFNVTNPVASGITSFVGAICSAISPQYNLGMILVLIPFNYVAHQNTKCPDDMENCIVCQKGSTYMQCECGSDIPPMSCPQAYISFTYPGVGYHFLMLFLQGVFFFALILLIESKVFKMIYASSKHVDNTNTIPQKPNEDSDVAEERRICQQCVTDPSREAILIVNLTKRYGRLLGKSPLVVDSITVRMSAHECFGLLGENGAGKSTTFKMLTGEVLATAGNAWLNGNDIVRNINKVQQKMGYCPQFDALISCMTSRETLTFYARLRGVPGKKISQVVNTLIDVMLLGEYANVCCGEYSGGNKRKLSTAISLVGNPDFILLDEPSAGMDPKARRQMWNILQKVRASGKTLILTSHSMEECDALCTKIVIMVKGEFVCLGSPQHLKNKFAQGYTVTINLQRTPDGNVSPCEPVIDFVTNTFKGAVVFDVYEGYVHFQVPDKHVQVADLFETLENNKEQLSIDDYAVQQTSLEQVFLRFTKENPQEFTMENSQLPPGASPEQASLERTEDPSSKVVDDKSDSSEESKVSYSQNSHHSQRSGEKRSIT